MAQEDLAFSGVGGAGAGPYAMPQIFGARLITVGPTAQIHALDKASGKVLWTRKLYDDFGGARLIYGYASHALAYRDTLILPLGGSANAVIALAQASGEKVWGAQRFTNGYTTPVLMQVDGRAGPGRDTDGAGSNALSPV